MDEHLDGVLEQRLGHGGAGRRGRLEVPLGGEAAQLLDGERCTGGDVDVGPGGGPPLAGRPLLEAADVGLT